MIVPHCDATWIHQLSINVACMLVLHSLKVQVSLQYIESVWENKFTSHPTHSLHNEPRFPFINIYPNHCEVGYLQILFQHKDSGHVTKGSVWFVSGFHHENSASVIFHENLIPTQLQMLFAIRTHAILAENLLEKSSASSCFTPFVVSFLLCTAPGNIWNQCHVYQNSREC